MTSITSLTIEADDAKAAAKFYAAAFGLGDVIHTTTSTEPTAGFRGFTLSFVVEQVATLNRLFDAAVTAGATVVKPVAKSMWGTGAAVQAPDGTAITIATSSKKDKGPAVDEVAQVILLLAADDSAASKAFYVDRGFVVAKSFGKYIEFEKEGAVGIALYARKALAKNAGVDPEGSGSHRLVVNGTGAPAIDPSGFVLA